MKPIILALGLLFSVGLAQAQENVFDFNDFKVVYLPQNELDQRFEVNTVVKNVITRSGLPVATTLTPIKANPALDSCHVLTCEVVHGAASVSGGLSKDVVFIHFFDCQGQVVYRCSAPTSVTLSPKAAYQNACVDALKKWEHYQHHFNQNSQRSRYLAYGVTPIGFNEGDSVMMASSDDPKSLKTVAEADAYRMNDDPNKGFKTQLKNQELPNTEEPKNKAKEKFKVQEYALSNITDKNKEADVPAVFKQNYTSADAIIAQGSFRPDLSRVVIENESLRDAVRVDDARIKLEAESAKSIIAPAPIELTVVTTETAKAEPVVTVRKSNLPAIFDTDYKKPEEIIKENTSHQTQAGVYQPQANPKPLVSQTEKSTTFDSDDFSEKKRKSPAEQELALKEKLNSLAGAEMAEARRTKIPAVFEESYKSPDEVIKENGNKTNVISSVSPSVSISTTPEPIAIAPTPQPVRATEKSNGMSDISAPVSSVTTSKFGMRMAPEFPGGVKKMFEFFRNQLKYPTDGTEGKVLISFIIDKMGNITTMSIEKGIRDDLDMEAIRVVSMMPPWRPAFQSGEPVRAKVVVPVMFKR